MPVKNRRGRKRDPVFTCAHGHTMHPTRQHAANCPGGLFLGSLGAPPKNAA